MRLKITRGLLSCTMAAVCLGGVIIDQIAVVVGKHVIKTSDIEEDLRVTDFLNGEAIKSTSDDKRRAAERLIDQEIIRTEINNGGFRRPPESQAAALEEQVRKDRFGGSQARLKEALSRYGISEDDLREKLLWQLTVLSFVDQRFRTNTVVSDQEVRAYYDQHLADLRRQYPKASSYEALQEKIRDSLQGERVNKAFTDWLDQVRNRYRIEYKQEALK